MPKQVTARIKLQVMGGTATPAPPVGPALGQHGLNIGEFIKRFNDQTADKKGMIIPVEITVFGDRTFDFVTKSPPASFLIKQAAGIAKGSGEPNKEKVGTMTWQQGAEIARTKMDDLNADDEEHAARIIAGTARSMGVDVEQQRARGDQDNG